MKPLESFTERELRARRHVAYSYLLTECPRKDERTGLHLCPDRVSKLVMMPMIEELFDFDLRGVPGFFYDTRRNILGELARMCGIDDHEGSTPGGWMLNTPDKGFVKAVMDDRARISALHVLTRPQARPRVLTSKGLPLGT